MDFTFAVAPLLRLGTVAAVLLLALPESPHHLLVVFFVGRGDAGCGHLLRVAAEEIRVEGLAILVSYQRIELLHRVPGYFPHGLVSVVWFFVSKPHFLGRLALFVAWSLHEDGA